MLLLGISVTVGLAMSSRLVRRPGMPAKLKRFHEASTLVTLELIAGHAGLLLFDGWQRPGLAQITLPSAFAYRPAFTEIAIIAGWLAVILGVSFYARRLIGVNPPRWRSAYAARPAAPPSARAARRPAPPTLLEATALLSGGGPHGACDTPALRRDRARRRRPWPGQSPREPALGLDQPGGRQIEQDARALSSRPSPRVKPLQQLRLRRSVREVAVALLALNLPGMLAVRRLPLRTVRQTRPIADGTLLGDAPGDDLRDLCTRAGEHGAPSTPIDRHPRLLVQNDPLTRETPAASASIRRSRSCSAVDTRANPELHQSHPTGFVDVRDYTSDTERYSKPTSGTLPSALRHASRRQVEDVPLPRMWNAPSE